MIPPKKKKYPKVLHVKDEEYRVVFVDRIEGKDTLGICDPEARVITIQNGQTDLETMKTFVHEVLHALEFEHNLRISHKLVHKLEDAITDFLIQNF